jgi:hypothetical protein
MKKRICVIVMAALMIMTMLGGCGSSSDKIRLTDYAKVSFSGNNGEGKATVDVDYDKLETDMIGGKDKVDKLGLDDTMTYMNAVQNISYSLDKSDGLSNGDKVVLSVTYDKDSADKASVEFDDTAKDGIKVSGLK